MGTAPGVAVPVVAADPATNVDVGITDDLFADIHDFDPTSGWGNDDEVTAAIPAWGDAEVTATVTTDAINASFAGADMAVEPVPTRQRRGKSARRGRDDEYYRHKWLRKADDPSASAPRNGSATPPHGGSGARA